MKSYFLLPLVFNFAATFFLEARIGETRLTIEKRLLKSGGYQYRDDKILLNRKRGMPYSKYEEYFPEKADLRIYYKTIDGKKPLSKDVRASGMLEGWNLHILFVQGKSVIELYKRSDRITEFEFIQLLNLQSGNSFWEKKSENDLEPGQFSTFGFDFQRNDQVLRAKKMGTNTVMIFSTSFDHLMKKNIREEQMNDAPSSVDGF